MDSYYLIVCDFYDYLEIVCFYCYWLFFEFEDGVCFEVEVCMMYIWVVWLGGGKEEYFEVVVEGVILLLCLDCLLVIIVFMEVVLFGCICLREEVCFRVFGMLFLYFGN